MAKRPTGSMEAVFEHLILAPGGDVEGAFARVDGEAAQLVVERGDAGAAAAFGAAKPGQRISLEATVQGPSSKGIAEHAVYLVGRVLTIDGAKPGRAKPALKKPGYVGKVARFNYARHGAKNGVVLDTGDFIHTKPEPMARLKLKVGDPVEADGDAWPLADGSGWVVEASVVNGKSMRSGPKD